MPPPDTERPVTILGAGIVGICTALSLLERGVPVQIIDRGPPGQETSMGNAGVISPWSFIPQSLPGVWKQIPKLMFGRGRPLSIYPTVAAKMLPWGWKFFQQGSQAKVRSAAEAMQYLTGPSVDLYRKHLDGTGHENLVQDSLYVHAFRDASRANLQSIDYRIRTEKGADLELIGRDALAAVEPALSKDFKAAVLIKGQARAVSPGRMAQVLAEKAVRLGARLITDDIQSLKKDNGDWRIQGTHDIYTCDRIILAMGVWSTELLEPLGITVPLMAERGYHIECPEPGVTLNNSVMDVDAKVVASSMEGGLRIAGQAEFAPSNAPPDARRKKQLIDIARAAFPDLKIDQPRFWMGRRPSFPDSLPALGETQDQDGLYLNFGHSHYGLMMAPKSGDILADLVSGATPNIDLGAYSVSRFSR